MALSNHLKKSWIFVNLLFGFLAFFGFSFSFGFFFFGVSCIASRPSILFIAWELSATILVIVIVSMVRRAGRERQDQSLATSQGTHLTLFFFIFAFYLNLLRIVSHFVFIFLFLSVDGGVIFNAFFIYIVVASAVFFPVWFFSSCSGRAPRCSALAGPWLNMYMSAFWFICSRWCSLSLNGGHLRHH